MEILVRYLFENFELGIEFSLREKLGLDMEVNGNIE